MRRWCAPAAMIALLGACVAPKPSPPAANDGCSRRVAAIRAAVVDTLATLAPGETLCIVDGDLGGEVLSIVRSGTAQRQIVIRAAGTRVGGIDVRADHVVVAGVEVAGGPGIALDGQGSRHRAT
jgi:hypothetical protein